jgi:UDP-glucose 4-epimerase
MSNKIKNNKILVTGGAGFIGSHLSDELLSRGYHVTVLDNLRNGSLQNLELARQHASFKFIKGNILNSSDCLESTREIDCVFHLACLGVRHSLHSPLENHRVNAEGTLNVLDACIKNRVKKFYYISTSEIYGGADSFPLNEETVPRPFTIYGGSKLAGEYYTQTFHRLTKLETTILRIFNNFGPRAHYEGDAGEIIPRAIVYTLYDKRPVIFGDGSITRDFFFVRDTANALAGLLKIEGFNGMTMNVGTGKEYNLKEIVEKVLILTGKKELSIEYIADRPADVPRLWVNAEKFKRLTGFVPKFTFADGLLETIAYYKKLAEGKNLLADIQTRNWEKK